MLLYSCVGSHCLDLDVTQTYTIGSEVFFVYCFQKFLYSFAHLKNFFDH